MDLANNGIIPDKKYYHNPTIVSNSGWTVAMMLGNNGVVPPKEWEHKPDL